MRIPKVFLVLISMTVGCATGPHAFPIPPVWESAELRADRLSDYPENFRQGA
jgi:hypothetical protein